MKQWISEVEELIENLRSQGITHKEILNQVRLAYKLGYDKGREDQKN